MRSPRSSIRSGSGAWAVVLVLSCAKAGAAVIRATKVLAKTSVRFIAESPEKVEKSHLKIKVLTG